MTTNKTPLKEREQQQTPGNTDHSGIDNTVKNPDDWKTGDEPLTGAQNSYLHTLASEAHEKLEEGMTKAEASKKIDELRQKTGKRNGRD